MIARIWHGCTTFENAKPYEDLLKHEILKGIAGKKIKGYKKIELLKRELLDECEFTTIMWFENIDAVKAFMGEDYETAYVLPEAQQLLKRYDTFKIVKHNYMITSTSKFVFSGIDCFFLFITGINCFGQKNMKPLFNGINFNGWEGDTLHTWHVEDSSIIGGSLHDTVAHNYFLCTKESYASFHLRLRFKLLGTEGFINSGIQFNAQWLSDPPYEMIGY